MEKGIQEGSLSEMEGRVEGSKRSWRGFLGEGGGGLEGAHSFIHPHSSSPPLLLLFAALKLNGGGGARWDTVWFSTVREGGVWGALHAILVKGVRETC